MSEANNRIAAAAVQLAFDALRTYDAGSGRGALMPLDAAVAEACVDPASARELEQRFLGILTGNAPAEARAYTCRKLAMIGSAAAVPALAALLRQTALWHEATQVLQSMPCGEAGEAMRGSLDQLSGPALAGVVTALGMRHEDASVEKLTALMASSDATVASAAVAALGEVGTPGAAVALREFLSHATPAIRPVLGDACLACAARLQTAGKHSDAKGLWDALLASQPAQHVREAGLRLTEVSGK